MECSLVLLLMLLPVCVALQDKQHFRKTGIIKACEQSDVNGTFSPTVISKGSNVTVRFSLRLKHRWAMGVGYAVVYVPGSTLPIFKTQMIYNCDEIKDKLGKCPIEAGELLQGQFNEIVVFKDYFYVIPAGDYVLKLTFENDSGAIAMCVSVNFHLINDQPQHATEDRHSAEDRHRARTGIEQGQA